MARLRKLAVRLAREEAPSKGQEALAAASFQNIKAAAADLAAIRGKLSSFRASFEALNETLLLALVSILFLLYLPFANFFAAGPSCRHWWFFVRRL